jgi:hypothetical protein
LTVSSMIAQSEAKGPPIAKHGSGASLRSGLQHEVNAEHPTGHVRAADEHLINVASHFEKKGMPPVAPGFAKKGIVPTSGLERKVGVVPTSGLERKAGVVPTSGLERKAGLIEASGMKKKGMELLQTEEKKGVEKLIQEGTAGMHKKGW